jgi:hypothetical protein
MINQLISSFNAGELSPYLESRTNLDKYRNGCKTLENFLITPYGPANRRSGLEYRGEARVSSTRCRLYGFNATAVDRYILEIGVGYIQLWKNGSIIRNTTTQVPISPVYLNLNGTAASPQPAAIHPYQESDLRDLKFCQVNDVVYIAHPDFPPMRVSRFSDTSWTISEVLFKWHPVLDQNITATTITPSAVTGTNITLTASAPLFSPSHVGSVWQIDHAVSKGVLTHNITANNTSAVLTIAGAWQVQSFGNWSADVILQASEDGGTTWDNRRTYVSRNDYNALSNGTANITTQFRFKVESHAASSGGPTPRIQISALDVTTKGQVRIKSVTGTATNGLHSTATAEVLSTLGSNTATTIWYEGAFSQFQGYPNVVGLHDSRLIFAGTARKPNTLFGSVTNDFQNFQTGPLAADSWQLTLATTTGGLINWIASKSELLIGTSLDEWSLSGGDSGQAITATSVQARAQSQYGSANLPAILINDTILYVQRMSRKLRELVYTWASESWISNDITALAEHTTRTHILEIAYQRVPDAVFWFVRGDGQLVSMTYEREQQVVGFARHITDGIIESVATINGTDSEDEVWVAVRRTINNQTKRYIERFRLGMRPNLDTGNKPEWFYLDSGVSKGPATSGGVPIVATSPGPTIPTSVAPASSATITGLSHLEGKRVAVWGGVYNANTQEITYGIVTPAIDPLTEQPMAVTGGQITLQIPVCAYAVGLPYTSLLCPERVDTQLSDGTSQSRKMRIPRLNVRLYQSFAGEYSSDQTNWFPMVARHTTDYMDDSPPVISTWTRLYLSSNWADGVDIFIRQNLPIPLTIAAVVPVWEVNEGYN